LSPLKRLAGGVSVCKSADSGHQRVCASEFLIDLVAGRQLHEIPVRVSDERDPQSGLGRVAGVQTERPPTSTARAWTASRSRRSSPDHRLTPHKKPKPASLRGHLQTLAHATVSSDSNQRIESATTE
jgi:hypothetical protein